MLSLREIGQGGPGHEGNHAFRQRSQQQQKLITENAEELLRRVAEKITENAEELLRQPQPQAGANSSLGGSPRSPTDGRPGAWWVPGLGFGPGACCLLFTSLNNGANIGYVHRGAHTVMETK